MSLAHEKPIFDYQKTLEDLKKQKMQHSLWTKEEEDQLESKLEELKNRVYSTLSPLDRVAICRHPKRPKAIDFIKNLCDEFTEIFGDRLYRDDPAIIAGLALIGGKKFMIVAQEKGADTESRLKRNFGMPHPEGYRKAMRCMELAAKFKIPVLSILDTPGAYPGLAAEERGQGFAIAYNLREMAKLKTAVIIVLIGEGCSGGALGMGIGDSIAMLEHAYYSVISPEGCASILWKDAKKSHIAAAALKMQSEDLLEWGIVDAVIKEPMGGAHYNPQEVFANTKAYILEERQKLSKLSVEELLENRYEKFRRMGRTATSV